MQALPAAHPYPFSVNGLTAPGSLRITAGGELLASWGPGDGWIRAWCERCGGHLYTTNSDDPDLLSLRVGALEDDPGIRPGAHQFVACTAPWEPRPDDGLPRCPERLPAGAAPPE